MQGLGGAIMFPAAPAILGTTLVSRMRSNVADKLVSDQHMPRAAADKLAAGLAQMRNGGSGGDGGVRRSSMR
ncbi:MAG: hypothetical protein JF587_20085 [Catenulisporales bacterium]|nr:hypothetical protein [Catenulisporales bacterium]